MEIPAVRPIRPAAARAASPRGLPGALSCPRGRGAVPGAFEVGVTSNSEGLGHPRIPHTPSLLPRSLQSRKSVEGGEVGRRGRRRGAWHSRGVPGDPSPPRRGHRDDDGGLRIWRQRGSGVASGLAGQFSRNFAKVRSPRPARRSREVRTGTCWTFAPKVGRAAGVTLATPPPYAKMCAYPVRRIYKRGKKKKNSSGSGFEKDLITSRLEASSIQRVAHFGGGPHRRLAVPIQFELPVRWSPAPTLFDRHTRLLIAACPPANV
jgi:hypothetical protein